MKPGKLLIIAVLVLFIGLAGYQIVNFYQRRNVAEKEWQAMQDKLQQAKNENAELLKELDYYSKPGNLEKELRSRFNLKKPDEKMIILVPASTTSPAPVSASSSQ